MHGLEEASASQTRRPRASFRAVSWVTQQLERLVGLLALDGRATTSAKASVRGRNSRMIATRRLRAGTMGYFSRPWSNANRADAKGKRVTKDPCPGLPTCKNRLHPRGKRACSIGRTIRHFLQKSFQSTPGLIPKWPHGLTLWGIPESRRADPSWRGRSAPCHQRSDCERTIRRASLGARPSVEGRQPEPAASVAGCGPGRHGPGLGGEDRRDGPPDAARLGPSLQRVGSGGPRRRQLGWRVPSLVFRRNNWLSSRQIVEAGPDREKDGVARWRRLDLKRVIAERFGVDSHPRWRFQLLKKLGFSHISARPRHPAQDERDHRGFGKNFYAEGSSRRTAGDHADRIPTRSPAPRASSADRCACRAGRKGIRL